MKNRIGMKNRKKSFVIIGIALTLVMIASLTCVYLLFKKEPSKEYFIEYNDSLSKLEITHSSGKSHTFDNEHYKLAVFLSDGCGKCIDALPLLDEINSIYCKNQPIEFLLLWEDEIPTQEVTDYGLLDYSYSLNNVRLSPTLDTIFLLDPNNRVEFIDSNGYENMISYLQDQPIIDKNVLLENSNEYILDNYVRDSEQPNLVFFSMPGCPDCDTASDIIYGSSQISENFNITRIERENGASETDIIDKLGIFENIYSIDWFPSFLIINRDKTWSIIRKTDVSMLEDVLLEHIS